MKLHILKGTACAVSMSLLLTACGSNAIPSHSENETTAAKETEAATEKAETEAPVNESKENTESSGNEHDDESAVGFIGFKTDLTYTDIYSDKKTGSDSKLWATGYYPAIRLGFYEDGRFMEYQGMYEELSDAIQKFNDDTYASYQELMKQCEEFAKDDQDLAVRASDDYSYYYSVEMNSRINRSDEVVFSIANSCYTFMGGPHPNTVFSGYNIDSKTGKVLKISDIVTDKDAFIDVLEKKLLEEYPDIKDGLIVDDLKTTLSDMYDGKDEMELEFSMYHDGIDISFSAYDLTAYAYGPEFVTLLYSDYEDMFNKKYLRVTDNYASEIDFIYPQTVVTADGLSRTLVVDYEPTDPTDEYGDSYDLTITLDENEYKETIGGVYNMYAYLFEKNHNSYLYLRCTSDNDWQLTYAYDLNGPKVKKIGEYNDIAFYNTDPVDPDDFIMHTRSGLISTYSISRNYCLAPDGSPKALTEYWWIDNEPELKLNEAASFSIMDDLTADGTDTGTMTELPEGTTLKPVRTDEESWVDAETEDGKYARIYVDASDWPHTTNGMDIEELFTGIVFAG
ncbi:RsiV family protein [Oribacterium sp. WCC10]|uniref:RsiV family protein n=1 Tax=Oribacterium sp. WCC10 TaxID=1855343 RepID=UPI0008DED542|nr:RsiV family protein [Oribacterium sp. WCC10]SFG51144.1 hypothetical protein SAMN05216356_11143 [Oribacterium sp. WCC10]